MNGVNKAIILGALGADPDVRYTQSGDPVANLSIATSEKWKDKQGQQQEKTEWHRVVLFKRQAEIAGEYLRKGSKVYIEGKIQTRKWQDQSGQDKYTTEIVANQIQLLGGSVDRPASPQSTPHQSANPAHGVNAIDDEVPF